MNYPELTEEIFKSQFIEFEDTKNIGLYLQRAVNYFEIHTCFCDAVNQYAVFLLTAHLLVLQNDINDGETSGGITQSASIDKISVSVIPAPSNDGFDYWLNQTIYGQELLAFINSKFITPRYIGGSAIRIL